MRTDTEAAASIPGSDEPIAQQWARYGHVILNRVVEPAAVSEVSRSIDEVFEGFDSLKPGPPSLRARLFGYTVPPPTTRFLRPDGQAGSLEVNWFTRIRPEVRTSALFLALERVAGELMGCEPQFYFDHVIRKPAGIGTGTSWHQDRAYNMMEIQRQRVNFWVPMADTDPADGCMQFVRGSHLNGLLGHHPLPDDPTQYALEADGDHDPQAFPVPLQAGGASIHHPLTLHKTAPNVSQHTRSAWIVHFIRPRTVGERVSFATRRLRPAQPRRL